MEGKMKVAVMEGIGKMGFTEREIPKPAANEVLVKLDYVGICGSDIHYYETGRIGDYVVEPPFVLGHEPGGVVVEVGSGVTDLKVGDRVALEPGKTCGHCEFCRQGKYREKQCKNNNRFFHFFLPFNLQCIGLSSYLYRSALLPRSLFSFQLR